MGVQEQPETLVCPDAAVLWTCWPPALRVLQAQGSHLECLGSETEAEWPWQRNKWPWGVEMNR